MPSINMCPSTQKDSCVETLTHDVMIFGDGVFGRWLDCEGGALMMELVPLKEETWGSLLPLPILHPVCEYTKRRRPSASQEAALPRLLAPSTFQSPELWEINVCCLYHTVDGNLLQ